MSLKTMGSKIIDSRANSNSREEIASIGSRVRERCFVAKGKDANGNRIRIAMLRSQVQILQDE
jgi:hypothetical protein